MQKSKWKKQNINVFEQMLIILLLMMCILLFRGTGICSNGMGGMNNDCANNFECSHKDFCEKEIGQCAGQGECKDKPRFCTGIWDPVCGCDGNTYPNKCEADRRAISVDYIGQCSPGVTQCTNNNECSPDSYCKKNPETCTAQGTCAPRPAFCVELWDPVCACDGDTYPNECEAAIYGVNVAYEGECSPGVTQCTNNSECTLDSYCKKNPGTCTAQGSCAPRPPFCPEVWDPVCGCDGISYPNDCEAAAQGVNVNHTGECQPGAVICTNNSGCSHDSYCQKAIGNCTALGTCTRRTHMCPEIWDPVCGCDGNTYPNECEAAAQGVNVNHTGECQPGVVTCMNNNACSTGSYCQKNLDDCSGQGECVIVPEQCPEIWSTVCGCDNNTYPNECFAAASGINVDYVGDCLPITASCTDSSTCPTGAYCQKTPGDCAIGDGRCATKPEVCTQIWAPVCGCDGKTYPNECEASLKGINVDYAGECAGTGPACIDNSNCQAPAACQKRPGNCGGQGICSPPPNSCPQIWAPVCGCDGNTYPNGCTATSNRVNVDYTGECSGSGISCTDINECSVESYCDKTPGDCAGEGECRPIPEACTQIWDPVCGCDGNTYPNECEAARLRITVNYPGECSAAGMLCQNNSGCPSFAYCQKSPGQCSEGFGECKFRPEFCIEVNSPVCGCDNKTYSNGCKAAANGVNIKHTGECPTPKPPPGYPYGGFLGGLLFGGFPFGGFPFGGFPFGGFPFGGFPFGGFPGGGFPGGTTFPGFSGGTTYPGYFGGTTYPGYFGGTTFPGFTGGTTYPGYFGGTTYPGYFGGTTYPGYFGGTTYPGYFGGTTYPGYFGGTTYPGYFGGTTYPGYFGTNPYSRFIGSTYP